MLGKWIKPVDGWKFHRIIGVGRMFVYSECGGLFEHKHPKAIIKKRPPMKDRCFHCVRIINKNQ